MSDSPTREERSSSVCSRLAILGAKCARRGTPKKSIYTHTDPKLAVEHVAAVGRDLQDDSCPPEVQSLGRTIIRWKDQIAAWHKAHVSNGPTEAANNLIKRIKRIAFGFRRFRNYRIRTLLYAGRPNWDLLATITPR